MSKLELDDQILNHDKFVLGVKRAGKFGGDVVFLWLGIRAYCGQRLSDGFVPTEMLDEVRGPIDPEQRAAALKVLLDVGLLEARDDGLQMHDFLQWSRSKSQVLADRERARMRQAKSQSKRKCDSRKGAPHQSRRDEQRDDAVTARSSASGSATASPSATTPKPPDVVDPVQNTRCPVPLPVGDETYAALELDIGMPRAVAEAALRAFAVDRAATTETRRIDTWISWALATIRARWSSDKAAMRAAAEAPAPEPAKAKIRTADDVLADRKRGSA